MCSRRHTFLREYASCLSKSVERSPLQCNIGSQDLVAVHLHLAVLALGDYSFSVFRI